MNDVLAPSPAVPAVTLFRVVLHPHRSLSPAGFRRLMSCVGAVSLGIGLLFYVSGAWPIVGFMGIDVALLYWAFKASYRSARACETVELTAHSLTVERVDHAQRRQHWTLQPNWLRVDLDDPQRPGSQVTLTTHGRSLVVGAFLSPEERRDFARSLRDALDRWRCGTVR